MSNQFFASCFQKKCKVREEIIRSEVDLQVNSPESDRVSGQISLSGLLGYPHDRLDPGWVYAFELVDHQCPEGLRVVCTKREFAPGDGWGEMVLRVEDKGFLGDRQLTSGAVTMTGSFAALPKCEVGVAYQLRWESAGRWDRFYAAREQDSKS